MTAVTDMAEENISFSPTSLFVCSPVHPQVTSPVDVQVRMTLLGTLLSVCTVGGGAFDESMTDVKL